MLFDICNVELPILGFLIRIKELGSQILRYNFGIANLKEQERASANGIEVWQSLSLVRRFTLVKPVSSGHVTKALAECSKTDSGTKEQ